MDSMPVVTEKDLIVSMWRSVETNKKFYVVVENNDHIYIDDPDLIEQTPYAEAQKQLESGVLFFDTPEGARNFKNYLTEVQNKRPSTLQLATVTLETAFQVIPKLNDYSQKLFGAPVRIQVIHYVGNFSVMDLLYSTLVPEH